MSNRLSRVAISIPTPSSDGRYYGRYPQGNRPTGAIAAAAASAMAAAGTLTTGSGNIVQSDWLARSTQSNVFFATDFSGPNDFDQTAHVFGESGSGQTVAYWKSLVTQVAGDARAPAKLRISSPASTGANGAAWYTSLNPGGFPGTSTLGGAWTANAQGIGNTPFWLAWRLKIPSSRLSARNSAGFKFFDLSCYSPVDPANQSQSNVPWEIICQNINWAQTPLAYHQDGSGYPAFGEVNRGPPINDIQITDQDNGAGITDLDQRYCLYDGGGTFSPGCWRFVPDTWIAFKMYVDPATYGGSAGNQFNLWAANQDDTSWTQIYNQSAFTLGQGPVGDGFVSYNGIWLNAYETQDNSNPGAPPAVDTYQEWWQVMASLSDIAVPAVGA